MSISTQGLSQDLETGCPILAMVNFLGVLYPIFQGRLEVSISTQGLSQDLKTGCPKLVIVKLSGHPILQEKPQYILKLLR